LDHHAVGAETFRCTGAFLRGRESFSPSDVTIQSFWLLLQVLPGGGTTSAGDISFRCSPLTRWPVSQVRRGYRGRLFLDSIERILYSARGSRLPPLDDSASELALGLAVILVFSGLPAEAGFLSGITLRS